MSCICTATNRCDIVNDASVFLSILLIFSYQQRALSIA
jgi:hypothetical protein